MKYILIAIVLLGVIAGIVFVFVKKEHVVETENIKKINTMQETKIKTNKEGTFKYFQMVVSYGNGIRGQVLLNNNLVAQINSIAGQVVSNEAQTWIADGKNTINISIDNINSQTDNAVFSNSVLDIIVYAMNEQDFPMPEDELIHLNWNPSDATTTIYTFDVSRLSK